MTLLSMSNICKSFFGNMALDNVNLEVRSGEIHALLGENGAGKTTLMNILYGIYTRDSGEILFKDKPVVFKAPKDAIECRIGMVHQHFMLVPTLTVSENITLGLKLKGHPFPNRKLVNKDIAEISDRYSFQIDPKSRISSLSVGEQQRVEIIKLLYRDTELLILDEPTAVLTPQETETFFAVLRKLRDSGYSIIIITHRILEVMNITDRITILRDGRNIATVNTNEITELELSEFMIGRQLNLVTRKPGNRFEDENFVLKGITIERKGRKFLDNINLNIGLGEIVGIAGVDGNGQKALAEVIVGIDRHSSGSIRLGDRDIGGMSTFERKQLGIGYIPSDRHHDALIMDMDLADNMLLKNYNVPYYIRHGLINKKLVLEDTEKAIEEYSIKTANIKSLIRYLSGGNQQKLILARELAGDPKVVVAFQPTRGLDISATEFVREKLLEHRAKGCSILLISTDLEEILLLSDRIAVIYEGKIMGVLQNKQDIDMLEIGLLMAGKVQEEVIV